MREPVPGLLSRIQAIAKCIIGPQVISPRISLLIDFSASLITAALALCSISPAARSFNAAQSNGELRLDLPANGNIRVENLRGSVIAQVWKESYVSIAAAADSGEARSLPAVVDRGQGLLSIRLERGPKGAARVNLELNIPERAHLAINTSDGPVDVARITGGLAGAKCIGRNSR